MLKLLCCTVALCQLSVLTAANVPVCDDIDTQACQLMHAKRPDMCNDVHMATSTCPRFCKNCPVTCYHCDIPLMDYHDCITTKTCAKGEACMLRQLKSTADGHDEYFMTCATKQTCDGAGLSFFFGKRGIQSRDVTAKCCFSDLCNAPTNQSSGTAAPGIPEKTSTTRLPPVTVPATHSGCRRDIVFIMDSSMRFYQSGTGIRPFLASSYYASIRLGLQLIQNVVAKLTIGAHDNLVAMASFDNSVHSHWDFSKYYDKNSLLQAISNLRRNISYKAQGNVEQAVQFVLNNALTLYHGDRPSYADDVVIVTDTSSPFHNELLKQTLHRRSHDVIVVFVQSGGAANGNVTSLATDSRHILHMSSYGGLTSVTNSLLQMLCS